MYAFRFITIVALAGSVRGGLVTNVSLDATRNGVRGQRYLAQKLREAIRFKVNQQMEGAR